MRDRLPAPGKENRVKITQDDGSVVEGVLSYADDAMQEGSAYTKGNVLPDAVCNLIGLSTESEPADMFNVLSHVGDLHVWRRTVGSTIDYPVSTNRNAYTEGTSAGTTIEYFGNLGDKARMQIVSYVGTGTYGESNPCSITADFPISIIIYLGRDRGINIQDGFLSTGPVMIASRLTSNYTSSTGFNGGNNSRGKKSLDSHTFYWYSTLGGSQQLNSSGDTYYFLCLG